MYADLIRALLAAAAAGVLPGYLWAAVLCPAAGLAERLAQASALSVASVPAVALVLAKLAGTGITLWVALGSVAVVSGTGALAFARRGRAPGSAGPVLPRPPVIRDPRIMALTAVALIVALVSRPPAPGRGWLVIVIAAALALAGVLAARAGKPVLTEEPDAPPSRSWRAPALAVALALIAVRAYTGVIRLDWPYIRGNDQFTYVVMAQQMLSHGSYGSVLIYPPGFPTLTAVICRLSGLAPLSLFPVLAPALLILTALGAYAVATRLWGREYGVAAVVLSGLVLTSAYATFGYGRYPDLIAAFFLMVMLVAALLFLYQSPSLRSGVLVTVVGGSVVLYHPVAGMYLALLIALVALAGLPYLVRKGRRRDARVLLLTLASVTALSACYAAYTYNLGALISGHSATSGAVTSDIGTQAAPAAGHLLAELGPAIVWLGVFGVAALAAGIRYLRRPDQVLAAGTVLMWCLLMYAGSRTAVDGFPVRFESDLGAPLSVTGALGAGMLLQSLPQLRATKATAMVVTSVAAAGALTAFIVLAAAGNILTDIQTQGAVLHRPLAVAGEWLRRHNTGGTIISTPGMNPGITNRAVLALGDYAGLQSYFHSRFENPRSLPPAGRQPLLDSNQVLLRPASCQAANVLVRDDVRYVVLYRSSPDADFGAFRSDPARYHLVFEDRAVIIYATVRKPCRSGQLTGAG